MTPLPQRLLPLLWLMGSFRSLGLMASLLMAWTPLMAWLMAWPVTAWLLLIAWPVLMAWLSLLLSSVSLTLLLSSSGGIHQPSYL